LKMMRDGLPVHRRGTAAERAANARAWRRGLRVTVRLRGEVLTPEELVWRHIVREWLVDQSDAYEAARAVLPVEVVLPGGCPGCWDDSE